jgi:hypothetical protein
MKKLLITDRWVIGKIEQDSEENIEAGTMSACFCIGPQGSETKCPCALRSEKKLNNFKPTNNT